MRIFYACGDRGIPWDGTKGASAHVRAFVRGLRRAGHDVHTFLDAGAGSPRSIDAHLTTADLPEAAALLGHPDVLYERYSLGCDRGLVAARAIGCPFVLEVNAPLLIEAALHRRYPVRAQEIRVEERLLHEADLVVTVSDPLRSYVAGIRGGDKGIAVVHNGCDPSLFPDAAAVDSASHVVAFLGHPKPWHGSDRLPTLLAELLHRGVPARLLVIGGGAGATKLQDRCDELGIGAHLEVTGPLPQTEATRRLLDAAIAVAPYRSDPFFYFCPLKIVECMAAGLPVVTCTLGDIPALVGDAGVLIPPDDDAALDDAVASLLLDPQRRARLGTRARSRALSELTWDAAIGRVTDLLEVLKGVPA